MSSIQFEIVDETPRGYNTKQHALAKWIDEVLSLARKHEGQTLKIDLTSEAQKAGVTPKALQMRMGSKQRIIGGRFVRLSGEGYDMKFRYMTTTTPTLFITYNKPITESEG